MLEILDKDKELGTKALIYIFLCKDETPNNPLKDLPFDERENDARYRVFGDYHYSFTSELGKEWATLISQGINAYELNEEEKDIFTYNKKIDELNTLLKGEPPKIYKNRNVNTDNITFSTNIGIINSILKDIINIIQAKASLVAMYTRGSAPRHLRGGLSPLAKQKISL